MLDFTCPQCQTRIRVNQSQAGQRSACPKCGVMVKVPGSAPTDPADDWDDLFGESSDDATAGEKPGKSSAKSADDDAFSLPAKASGKQASPAPAEKDAPAPDGSSDDDEYRLAPLPGDASPQSKVSFPMAGPGGGEIDEPDDPLADVPNRPSQSEPDDQPPDEDVEFPVTCPNCECRIYARLSQVGSQEQCPDCWGPIPIVAPQKLPKKKGRVSIEEYESFQLKDGVTPHRFRPVTPDEDPEELIRRAEQGDDDEARGWDDDEMPQLGPWARDLFGFLAEPNVILRLILGTIVLTGVSVAIHVALDALREGPGGAAGMFAVMFSFVVIAVLGLIFTFTLAAHGVSIIEGSAQGARYIERWPGIVFFEWLGEAFAVAICFAVAAMPGFLLAHFLTQGTLNPIVTSLFVSLTTFIFFPFLLLSVMENNSPFAIFSPVVWESLQDSKEDWGVFYLSAAVVMFGWFLTTFFLLTFGFVIVQVLASAVWLTLVFIYFRLLGRLAAKLSGLEISREEGKGEEEEVIQVKPRRQATDWD